MTDEKFSKEKHTFLPNQFTCTIIRRIIDVYYNFITYNIDWSHIKINSSQKNCLHVYLNVKTEKNRIL